MNFYLRVCFFFLILFCSTNVNSKEEQINLTYKIQWGNLVLGEAIAKWKFKENKLTLKGKTFSVGAISTFSNFESKVHLEGIKHNDEWFPKLLEISSITKDGKKYSKVFWDKNRNVVRTTRIPDINLKKVYPINKEHFLNTIDPWSAMLQALKLLKETNSCKSSFNIYDGRRTAILYFEDLELVNLQKDRPWSYSGKTKVCGMLSKSTGGHLIKSKWRKKNSTFSDIKIYLADMNTSFLIPVRIEVKTFLGKIIARLNVSKNLLTQ